MLNKEDIAEMLLNIDAVSISLTHPFKYASGLLSPIYTNCRLLSSHPKEKDAIIEKMIDEISGLKDKVDVVISSGASSIFIATLLAEHLKLPMAYVRPNAKTHGKKKEIEGIFKVGDRVLLISDTISTENDIPNSVEKIQKNGGTIVYCLSIFSNNIGIIESFLKEQEISFSTLTDLETLLKVASENGRLSLEEKAAIEEWAKNPNKWYDNRLRRIEESLENIKKSTAQILLEIGAVTINLQQPFKYTSGILSPIYTDNRLLISYPDKWQYVIESFVNVITNVIGVQNFDVIAGTATAGIPHATLIAERLGLPMVYVKFEQDEKGKHGHIEGKIKKGDRVIMIEDLVSTGDSVLLSTRVLRDSGAIVDWCVAIFTYDTQKSKSTFDREKINLITLSDLITLMKVGIEMKYIGPKERDEVIEWLENPEYWAWKKREVSRLVT